MDLNAILGIASLFIGCFVGLAGWLAGRDKKISGDAEWRGEINGKLNAILGIKDDVGELADVVHKQGERITAAEESTKQAHKRLDEHIRQNN